MLNSIITAMLLKQGVDKEEKFGVGKLMLVCAIGTILSAVLSVVIFFAVLGIGKNYIQNQYNINTLKNKSSFEAALEEARNDFFDGFGDVNADASGEYYMEPEPLAKEYESLYNAINMIDEVQGEDGATIREAGMVFCAGSTDRCYICSDGYYIYVIDCSSGSTYIDYYYNYDGTPQTINQFFEF